MRTGALFALALAACSQSAKSAPMLPRTTDLLTDGLADVSDHARMVFGDSYFLDGNTDAARRYYQLVTGRAGSPYRTLANYKLGWLLYRNDLYVAAIGYFEAAIEHSNGSDEATLRAEAVLYIAISLTEPWTEGEMPQPADAVRRAIERYGGGDKPALAGRVFEALGDVLRDQAAAGEARESYELALEATPSDSPLRPGLRMKIDNLVAP